MMKNGYDNGIITLLQRKDATRFHKEALLLAVKHDRTYLIHKLLDAGVSPFLIQSVHSECARNIVNQAIAHHMNTLCMPLPLDVVEYMAEFLYLGPLKPRPKPSYIASGAILQLVARGLYDVLDCIDYPNTTYQAQTNGRITGVPTTEEFRREKKIKVFKQGHLTYDPDPFMQS
jgi:hypothetical protein